MQTRLRSDQVCCQATRWEWPTAWPLTRVCCPPRSCTPKRLVAKFKIQNTSSLWCERIQSTTRRCTWDKAAGVVGITAGAPTAWLWWPCTAACRCRSKAQALPLCTAGEMSSTPRTPCTRPQRQRGTPPASLPSTAQPLVAEEEHWYVPHRSRQRQQPQRRAAAGPLCVSLPWR